MNKIIILGAGGHMSEQTCWIEDYFKDKKKKYEIIICSEKKMSNKYDYIKENKIKKNTGRIFIGIGNPKIRKSLIKKFKNYNHFSLKHPSAIIANNAKIGVGVAISPFCIIGPNTNIGNFNLFNCGSYIHHDCQIGDNNIFNPGAKILGGCEIKNNNYFGANSCIKQQLKVGNDNIIGANSFIDRNIDNNKKYGGVPAKRII